MTDTIIPPRDPEEPFWKTRIRHAYKNCWTPRMTLGVDDEEIGESTGHQSLTPKGNQLEYNRIERFHANKLTCVNVTLVCIIVFPIILGLFIYNIVSHDNLTSKIMIIFAVMAILFATTILTFLILRFGLTNRQCGVVKNCVQCIHIASFWICFGACTEFSRGTDE